MARLDIEYRILEATSPEDLEKKVNLHLNNHWELAGAMSVMFAPVIGYTYYQPVVVDHRKVG